MTIIYAAQGLNDQMTSCKEVLEDICISGHEQLTEEDKAAFRIIRVKLSNKETLKPLGYFALNKQTLLAVLSTCLTYCIILMQFKQVKF